MEVLLRKLNYALRIWNFMNLVMSLCKIIPEVKFVIHFSGSFWEKLFVAQRNVILVDGDHRSSRIDQTSHTWQGNKVHRTSFLCDKEVHIYANSSWSLFKWMIHFIETQLCSQWWFIHYPETWYISVHLISNMQWDNQINWVFNINI